MAEDKLNTRKGKVEETTKLVNDFNAPMPQLTEQLADNSGSSMGNSMSSSTGGNSFSAVDYIANSQRSKGNSLLQKIDVVKDDSQYFSSMFAPAQPNKVSFNEERINVDEAYTKLSDGSYITRYDEGFIKGADNEQRYAEGQSTASKWANGMGKFLSKTGVNIAGGTLGTAYGAIAAITEGNWEKIYDNSFYDFLDDQNTKLDTFAANYRKQEERDMGFFESATTANFWADDFLGGLSFMTGTVISEALWAAGTGGASLATTAARVSLRGAKFFKTAQALTKGVKEAQKTLKVYNRLSAMQTAAKAATTAGKYGETANLLRFTYTGAGFEAGMEARLYQKEQRDSFERDFETLNGRPPEALDRAEFEDNLGSTTNALWATNMALVGTSNFAILGKTFGITSPFKLQSKGLNKALFGVGEVTQFGKQGERLASTAIKRSGLQKTLGFSKALLANPFMEGVVEEGGQAASSSAMESFVTSRYNPSEDAMSMSESMYEGLAHTYGTKEGWKEVGLGALIGFFGGEATSVLSGDGIFTAEKEALADQDKNSVARAKDLNENLGTTTVNKIFAAKIEQNLTQATALQNAQAEYSEAEKKGDLMGMSNAQSKIMLTSAKHAVDQDYLEDQVADFRTSLDMQTDEAIAEHYEIDVSQVEAKKEELTQQFKDLGSEYKTAKEFADYTISDNPKELFEDATDVDVAEARGAIAYQMVMTGQMEKNMEGAHGALLASIVELRPALAEKYRDALNKFDQLRRSSAKDVAALGEAENNVKVKKSQIELLNTRLKKINEKVGTTPESRQRAANKVNALQNKMAEFQAELETLTNEVADKAGNLATQRSEIQGLSATSKALASQLDMIDPLAGTESVSQTTIEETQQKLEDLDTELAASSKANPMLVKKIAKLAKEYKTGLEMWQRNADTLADLTDPELGLKRIGTMFQKKKTAGETTLKFLERLKKTAEEERLFTVGLEALVEGNKAESEVADPNDPDNLDPDDPNNPTNNEQTKSSKSPGEDVTVETEAEILAEKRAKLEKERAAELAAAESKESKAEIDVLNSEREAELDRIVDANTGSKVRDNQRLSKEVNDRYDTAIQNLADNATKIAEINAKYDAKLKALNKKKPAKRRTKTAEDKIADLKAKLKELVTKNKFLLQNFTDRADNLSQAKAPTETEVQEYEKLKENLEPTDAAAIVGTPIANISKKVRERVNLTDAQITRFQDLAQKMQDWRIVTATNSRGISIQDILDQIEAYQMTIEENNTQVSADQQLEMAREGEKDFSVGESNKDIAQTMSYVNTAKDGPQVVFSHLDIQTIKDNGYEVVLEGEENVGTDKDPSIVEVYTISKDGESFEIRKVKANSRIAVSETLVDKFLKGMGFEVVKYKLKTAWGYVFQNGNLLKSDFGIESIDQSETEIMHPELIYEMKPGEKLSFVVSIKDAYNFNEMQELMRKGDEKGAEANMAIYIVNKDGKVVGMLKAGADSKNSNFNKVRKAAFKVLKNKLNNKNLTIEDILDENTESSFNLPYEVEVEKIFIGTPDIKLKEDGSLEVFKITEDQYGMIEGKGYAENGKLEQEDPEVRMTFIPKDKNTPYVIIRQGNTKIAFPVGVTPTASTLQDQVLAILGSDLKKQNQITEIVKLLARNGVDPVQFNLNILNTNEKELEKLLTSLDDAKRTFTKEELRTMSKEDFLAATEIVVNLANPAFVSPKVKTTLSKNLLDKETKEETQDEPLTLNEKLSLILNNSVILAKATNKKEVAAAVIETGDSVLQEEFNNNKEFKKQVEDFAIASSVVPVVETEYTIENLIEDTVDLESEDVPLDLKEEFRQEVADLVNKPTKAKIKALGKKLLAALSNRYIIVKASMDTANLYNINTTESEEEMFAQGFVRVGENFYKKVNLSLQLDRVLEGLFMKYKKGTLPSHMRLKPNMNMEAFTAAMPKTLLDVYKKYYASQPAVKRNKKTSRKGTEDDYLRTDFMGDFARFKKQEKAKGSAVYKEVLAHMSTTSLGIKKADSLTREKIDEFEAELGPIYSALLQYSLINKHIDLQEQPQTIIFAEDIETHTRIEAVNSSSLKEAKGAMLNFNGDGSITLGKGNADFVTYKEQVYEKVQDAGNGEYDYYPIAKVDKVFYVTEVAEPFINKPNINKKEKNEARTTVNKTDKDGGLDCT